ncbi:type II inositol polyphosphate 5-phosphatase 15-like [Typha angustifolia]|uniref:type II inositol polyphosphate 5-phosphatase 15-like n=1 Tax=Typha angustifolia TaxID=59011 RepID=UPI003C2ADA6C
MAEKTPPFSDWDDLAADFFTTDFTAPLPPPPPLPPPAHPAPTAPTTDSHWPPPPGPHHSTSLPEFSPSSSAAAAAFFHPPPRTAVDPSCPPPLELRPRPLRETQAGVSLRSIACAGSALWAAHDAGVRVWDLTDVFRGAAEKRNKRRGDEESAPFLESCRVPPAICLAVDLGRGVVWSGHRDGRILGWRMEKGVAVRNLEMDRSGDFKECIVWEAHRAPVLSMVVTPYGELWSGSEGGVIKVWSMEAIDESISLRAEESRKAASLVERSYVDLSSLVTDGGVSPLPTVDVKLLLSDTSRSKVWSGGYLSFALWDCHTKELLKVISTDGQIETRFDVLSVQDPYEEQDTKMNFFSLKKEKSQGSMSFFQRSRNALMGAADAVRRVAVKAAFGDDNRRTEALAMSMDGMIWIGCANGSLAQWDGNGHRIQEFQHHSSAVQSICTFGTRLWVGYIDGTLQFMDLEGNLLGGWVAHSGPIIKMAVRGSYIFTLANYGGIRGWNLSSPGPLDSILRSELTKKELSYKKAEYLKMLVASWNVGQERASYDSLNSWLGSAASEIGLVVVGLQEVEMGAGFLAMAAAKETVGLEGSPNGQWWLDTIGKILYGASFEFVGSRQLAGLLIAVWAKRNLKQYIGDIDTAAVPCGFGRAIGNKGAVSLRMRIYAQSVCFVNCHFAAHMEAVSRRNEDFDHVFRTMTFSSPSSRLLASAAGASAVQFFRGANTTNNTKSELSEADMVVFLGDFNYRLHDISYDEAMGLVSQRCFDKLREKDQLRAEMRAGRVFQGLREGQLMFPPTYKFEKHQPGLSGYDSSEKKRIPAWCDRILYRDSRTASGAECSLNCPVVSSISLYDSCMDATDSDHKPVKCIFNVDIAHADELVRRKELGEIILTNKKLRCLLEELQVIPEVLVSTDNIILQNQEISAVRVTNKCSRNNAAFEIICEDMSSVNEEEQTSMSCGSGSSGFPKWLKVTPAVGLIYPGQTVEVSFQHGLLNPQEVLCFSQNRCSEDNQDKIAMLLLKITGCYHTEAKRYRINVQHSSSRMPFTSKGAKPSGPWMW